MAITKTVSLDEEAAKVWQELVDRNVNVSELVSNYIKRQKVKKG